MTWQTYHDYVMKLNAKIENFEYLSDSCKCVLASVMGWRGMQESTTQTKPCNSQKCYGDTFIFKGNGR